MKKIYFLSILIFISLTSVQAQIHNSKEGLYTLPTHITSEDSVKVVYKGYRASGSIKTENISYVVRDSIVDITMVLTRGIGTQKPYRYMKEIMLAPLEAGHYTIRMFMKMEGGEARQRCSTSVQILEIP